MSSCKGAAHSPPSTCSRSSSPLYALSLALCHGRARAAAMADSRAHSLPLLRAAFARASRVIVFSSSHRRHLPPPAASPAAAAPRRWSSCHRPMQASGRPCTPRLGPSQVAQWVRSSPLWLPRPSAVADEPSLAGISELQRAPCSNIHQGPRAAIRQK
jgi:hypothetical protein